MSIEFKDNSPQVKAAFNAQILAALETCGLAAEGYAKKLCPVDTGNLRNSITHTVNEGEQAAYVGTNSNYAIYVEMDTGIYANGTRSGSETTFTDTSGMDFYWARQYAGGYFSKAFKVSSGDTVSIEFGTNGDSGDGTRRWAFSFIG